MKAQAMPTSIKNVRRLMLLYVAVILIGTIIYAFDTGFVDKRELFRGMLRAAGFSYLAWWLPSLDKRAWWASVIACGVLAVLGLGALLLLPDLGAASNSAVLWTTLKVAVAVYALAHAFIILMQSETRNNFEA